MHRSIASVYRQKAAATAKEQASQQRLCSILWHAGPMFSRNVAYLMHMWRGDHSARLITALATWRARTRALKVKSQKLCQRLSQPFRFIVKSLKPQHYFWNVCLEKRCWRTSAPGITDAQALLSLAARDSPENESCLV